MKTRDEALELVKAAFLQAQRKPGAIATEMTLAVFKNRLLQITDRRFDPKDFGAIDIKSFVVMLSPDVSLTGPASNSKVALTSALPSNSPIRAQVAPAKPHRKTSTTSLQSEMPLRTGRIREDLWSAIMDYASGSIYVWDDKLGRARASHVGEEHPIMPTLTAAELGEWRRSFLGEHRESLEGRDLASAQRWQELGLSTTYLPVSLQQPWNKELGLRVRLRLQEFFSKLKSTVTSQPSSLHPSTDNESTQVSLRDALTAAKDRGDGFTVGELLAQELGQAPSRLLRSAHSEAAR